MEDDQSRPRSKLRAESRIKCRQTLSQYLGKKTRSQTLQLTLAATQLGIQVEPANVRLVPEPGDGYQWKPRKPDIGPLLQKQISKHSTKAYMRLCREVGNSFIAVAEPNPLEIGGMVRTYSPSSCLLLRQKAFEHDTVSSGYQSRRILRSHFSAVQRDY